MAAKDKARGRGNSSSTNNVKDLKDLTQQGRAADELLNGTLQKALNEMKENARDWIEESEPKDVETREDLYRFIRSINTLNKQLKIYFNKGSNAALKLKDITNGGSSN